MLKEILFPITPANYEYGDTCSKPLMNMYMYVLCKIILDTIECDFGHHNWSTHSGSTGGSVGQVNLWNRSLHDSHAVENRLFLGP